MPQRKRRNALEPRGDLHRELAGIYDEMIAATKPGGPFAALDPTTHLTGAVAKKADLGMMLLREQVDRVQANGLEHDPELRPSIQVALQHLKRGEEIPRLLGLAWLVETSVAERHRRHRTRR